jgi:hypothetical protein
MTRPFFTQDRISHFDIFDRHAEDVINQMKARLNEGIAVDVQVRYRFSYPCAFSVQVAMFKDAFCRYTLDSASEFLFGNDIRSLSAGLTYPRTAILSGDRKNEPSNGFADAFTRAQISSVDRLRYGKLWPLVEFWEDKVKREMKNVHKFIEPIIEVALENKKNSVKTNADEGSEATLLEHLIEVTDGKCCCLFVFAQKSCIGLPDPMIIRDEILNIMVAGRDTARTFHHSAYIDHDFDTNLIHSTRLQHCSLLPSTSWRSTPMFLSVFVKKY